MGQPKALLDWHGSLLIDYVIEQARAAGVTELAVVISQGDQSLQRHLEGKQDVRIGLAPASSERPLSIQIGARLLPHDTDPILLLNVDQPRPRDLLTRLMDAHHAGGKIITIPVHGSHHGEPVVIGGRLLPELQRLDGTWGLRDLLRQYTLDIAEVALDDEIVLVDINSPEEYNRALQTFGLRAQR